MNAPMTRRRGGLAGPLILIAFGLVFLMNNLGYLDWSIWQVIFRLWPVLLIGIGLDLVLQSRQGTGVWAAVGSLLILAAVLTTMAVGAWLTVPGLTFGYVDDGQGISLPRISLARAALRTETVAQPLESATRADVELGFGVGLIDVRSMSEPSGLIEGTVVLQDDEKLRREFHVSSGTAYFKMRNETVSVIHNDGPYRSDDRTWELELNPEIPMRLRIDGGVGNANLDLSKLLLTGLEVHTGVSNTTLALPNRGQYRATVEGGVGNVTITIPRDMAARIRVERGLSRVDLEGNYQPRGSDLYVSPGYETAQDRVDLTVKGGVGKIRIQESE